MTTDSWRYRCPEGHADVVRRQGPTQHGVDPKAPYYCRTCKKGDGDPHCEHVVDAKTGQEVRPAGRLDD